MSTALVYLASPKSFGHLKWSRLECLKASVILATSFLPRMPIFIFHEDYTEAEFQFLREFQPHITFLPVNFSGCEEQWKSHRPSERVGSYGYCMMCRFFSGIMQDSPFLDPKRTGFTHYMRLDDDSYVIKMHRSFMEHRHQVLVPKIYTQCFMLHEVWAPWNHIHQNDQ